MLVVVIASSNEASPSDEGPYGLTAVRQKLAAGQRKGSYLGWLLIPQERAVPVWGSLSFSLRGPLPRTLPPSFPPCRRMVAASPLAMAAASVHRLGHVALRVADMERAKAFYTALGLRLTWDAADWAYLQSPITGDGIALLSPDYTAAGPHFAFHLDNRAAVDAVHDQLEASGHRVGAVHDHRDGTASFYLQDPEGNWLEILYEPTGGIPSNTGTSAIPFAPLPASEEPR